MDCQIVDVGESVLLNFPEFSKCGKLEIPLKHSVIGKHVIAAASSCGARNLLPSGIILYLMNSTAI